MQKSKYKYLTNKEANESERRKRRKRRAAIFALWMMHGK